MLLPSEFIAGCPGRKCFLISRIVSIYQPDQEFPALQNALRDGKAAAFSDHHPATHQLHR